MKQLACAIAFLFVASFASAQSFDFGTEAGGGYANVEHGDWSNVFGQVYVGGVNWNRVSGGVVYEFAYDQSFNQRVYARGSVSIAGGFYAAVDTALNGEEWDPRAVAGLNYNKFVIEGYGKVDGDRLFGISVRWKVF